MEIFGIPFLKKGGIHIKKKNKGLFTKYCNGKVTEECIQKGKNSPDPKIRKRATFAQASRSWSKKHQSGGSILKCQNGKPVFKRLDVQSLKNDPEYKNFGWYIEDKNIAALQDSLINRNAGYPQRVATLAMVIPENGGRTTPHGNGAFGLVGWRGDRAKNLPQDFGGQAHKLMVELFDNSKGKDWTHGGAGTGVNTGKEMYELFNTSQNTAQTTKALMKGYVRPPKNQYDIRLQFISLLNKHMK